jgi:hypothetical protein
MPKENMKTPSQFQILYRVFYLRVIDLEVLSSDGDTQKLMGQFGALFAAVSLLFTAPLIVMGGGLSPTVAWTAEHLLIATTMVVVGILSVLNWDSVFPDRRDILVLAPLPIQTRTLFWAKLSALAAVLGISILALNIFTGLTWPLMFSPTGGLLRAVRSLFAYWITIAAAGGFIFCSVLNLQGVMALLLPRQYFLRLSAFLQAAAFGLLLFDYFLEPSLESIAALTAAQNQRLLACLPSYWFLGLFQQLNGSMQPAFAPLARRAWVGFFGAIVLAVITVLLSYFHTLRKTIEQPDILPAPYRANLTPRLGNSLNAAVMMFSLRSLLRSRQHRVILSFYLGVGFTLVLAIVKAPFQHERLSRGSPAMQLTVPLLAASILMLCVTVCAIRIVSAIPLTLRANWIFRITELRGVPEYMAAIRRTLVALGVVPVWLGITTLFFYIAPGRFAVEHLLLLAILGAVLVELCTLASLKIPFACSYRPGKGNVQFAFWALAAFLVRLIVWGARLEKQALNNSLQYAATILVLLLAWAGLRWRAAADAGSAPALHFDDVAPAEVITLNLSRN